MWPEIDTVKLNYLLNMCALTHKFVNTHMFNIITTDYFVYVMHETYFCSLSKKIGLKIFCKFEFYR